MVMLLLGYGAALWAFLKTAPKVYTLMVSDLEVARQFYADALGWRPAAAPLQYYHDYERSLGLGEPAFQPLAALKQSGNQPSEQDLWFQVKRQAQVHLIAGARRGPQGEERHVALDADGLALILRRTQGRGLRVRIRQEKPLQFQVKDLAGRVIDLSAAKPR